MVADGSGNVDSKRKDRFRDIVTGVFSLVLGLGAGVSPHGRSRYGSPAPLSTRARGPGSAPGPAAGLQIMLLDGTTFSVGPNSSMVIDEFVFDPSSGTGKLTASISKSNCMVMT